MSFICKYHPELVNIIMLPEDSINDKSMSKTKILLYLFIYQFRYYHNHKTKLEGPVSKQPYIWQGAHKCQTWIFNYTRSRRYRNCWFFMSNCWQSESKFLALVVFILTWICVCNADHTCSCLILLLRLTQEIWGMFFFFKKKDRL